MFLVVWCPTRALRFAWPSALPEAPVAGGFADVPSKMALLLQILGFVLLVGTNVGVLFKAVGRSWCAVVGRALGVESYLLRDGEDEARAAAAAAAQEPPGFFGAAHFAGPVLEVYADLLSRSRHRENTEPRPYVRPANRFAARLVALCALAAVTAVVTGVAVAVVPHRAVRVAEAAWRDWVPAALKTHEMFTALASAFLCLMSRRFAGRWPVGQANDPLYRVLRVFEVGSQPLSAIVVVLGVLRLVNNLAEAAA